MYGRGLRKSVEKEPYKKAFFQQELFNNVWIFFIGILLLLGQAPRQCIL
jgi:hypothetical protein